MNKARVFRIIGVALALTLVALPAFAADPNPGKGNTDVVVQNTTASTAAAKAIYYDTDGNIDYQNDQSIAGRGSFVFRASDATLGDNWQGSMVLQSDNELAAVAEIRWTEGSSADRTRGAAYTGYAAGTTEVYLPYVAFIPNAQWSSFTVQNTEDRTANLQIVYIDRTGGALPAKTDTLPKFGSKTYNMNQPGGAVPDFTQTAYYQANCANPSVGCQWSGAVKITSTGSNPPKITVVGVNNYAQYTVSYNAFTAGSTTTYAPSVTRRCTDCAFNGGTWQEWSVITVQCLETSQACNVTMDFAKEDGTPSGTLPTQSIVAGGAKAASTRNGNDWDYSWFNTNLSGGAWAGSAVVRSTNNTKIAVVVFNIRPNRNYAGGTSGASSLEAGTEIFLPAAYQIGTTCPPGDGWSAFSIFGVQNPGTTAANDVDIYFYDRNGSQRFVLQNQSIPGGKAKRVHTRLDCGTLNLGLNWSGSIYVKADVPVVAVIENHFWGTQNDMMAYNSYEPVSR